MREPMIQHFAKNDVTQTSPHQLNNMRQQPHKPVAQFAVKMKQLLILVDPNMRETMKLYFFLPWLWHDIYPPYTIMWRMKGQRHFKWLWKSHKESMHRITWTSHRCHHSITTIILNWIHNPRLVQWISTCKMHNLYGDNQGKQRCFYCNGYGHVKKHCRKFAVARHHQNVQIQLADSASMAEVSENKWARRW